MPRVKLDDGSFIRYDVLDLADPWLSRRSVFMHHGLAKFGSYWLPWARLLARQFRVVTIDSLGNGGSSRPRGHEWSIPGYAANAGFVIESLDLGQVHFIGEGLGGCVGMYLAATRPDLVRTLTLSATPFRPADGTGRLDLMSQEIARDGIDAWIDKSVRDRMDWSKYPPEMYAWYRAQRRTTSPRILAEQMAAQAGVDLEWTLPKIEAPTLLIVPGKSHVNAHDQMLRMGEVIKRSRVVEFPDEGQWVTFARPDECVAAFLRFVGDLEPADRGSAQETAHVGA